MSRLLRFGAVGLVATLVHLGVALGLAAATAWPVGLCHALAWVTALGVSFLGHHRWSFASTRPVAATLPRYVVLSALTLALSTGIALLGAAWGWPRGVAVGLAALSVPPLGYLAARVVFGAASKP